MVSLAVQKLWSLIRPHFFIFTFISFILGDWSKKLCYDLCQRVFCLCSLLGVLWFQIIHLGRQAILSLFLFMVWGNVLISLFYMCLSSLPRTTCWRDCLVHCIFLPPLSKMRWPYVCGFISGLSILFHWSIFLFLCQYHTGLISVAL